MLISHTKYGDVGRKTEKLTQSQREGVDHGVSREWVVGSEKRLW